MSMEGPHSLGSTYPVSKWIFVGAKLSDEKREQRIKGVLAHELCHYVMRLVYENQENPYYKHMLDMAEMFEEIVKAIDKWSTKGAECPEDECNRIISSVFQLYSKDELHLELIVRVVQILVEFDDDEEKLKSLEDKYKILFDFWELQVIPELRKFNLKEREDVRKMNRIFELLPSIKSEKIEFCASKDIKALTDNKLVIVTSNVPKLLLINIHKHLQEEFGDLIDTKNVFVDPQKLKNQEILSDFTNLLTEKPKLIIFVDCSKEVPQNLKLFEVSKESKLTYVVSNEAQSEELQKMLKDSRSILAKVELNYKWIDLKEESQEMLLETKINFQNNSQFSLMDLLRKEVNPEEPLESRSAEEHDKNIINDYSEIIDAQLLKLLVENSEIQINQQTEEGNDWKQFRVCYQARKLIKKFKVNKRGALNVKNLAPRRVTRGRLLTLTNSRYKQFIGESSSSNTKEQDQLLETMQKTEIEKIEKIAQDVLLKDVSNQKYALISDKAGSGKTWIVKNVTNMLCEKHLTNWVTYIDLKQFIGDFKAQKVNPEFLTFFIENVLKPKHNFEAQIFKMLYKKGKVFILFDGFDEIAPNCAEFVSKLAQSFEFNCGNQLWIATRDYFEVDLKKKLQLDAVYKLDEFTEEHGIELIASSWILSEIEDKHENDIFACIKSSPNYENYKKNAKKLSIKVTKFQSQSIGFPQFYKIIADVCKNKKKISIDFASFKLFKECVNMQYERWSREKGELRAKANIESQHKDVNFHKLHQIIAMESLFPDESKFCDLDLKNLDWSDEEIIACGLLSKKGDKFYFSHETFREFYAADFMIRILTNKEVDDKFCEYLLKFLTIQEFAIIRMFLNEAFGDESILKELESKIPALVEYFYKNAEKLQNFSLVFGENLENLANFFIVLFKTGNYNQTKNILMQNIDILKLSAQHANLFIKFGDFIIIFFNVNDLKKFLLKHQIFLWIFRSCLDIVTTKGFIEKVSSKTDNKLFKKNLQIKDKCEENLFFYAIRSKNASAQKFQEIFEILSNFLTFNEIFNLTKECNISGWNILHVCANMKHEGMLKLLWREVKEFYPFQNSFHQFKQLISQKSPKESQNLLHFAAFCNEIEFHLTLWELLLETFENHYELKNLVIQKDKYGNDFIHCIVLYTSADLVELTFKKIKYLFDNAQHKEILGSKGFKKRNLLQQAVLSKDVNTLKFLWNLFQSYIKYDNFLYERDMDNNNIFHIAASFSTGEVFEFIMKEIEENFSKEEIRNFLNTRGCNGNNLFKNAVTNNNSLKLHEILWQTIREYFTLTEILKMIARYDIFETNLLTYAVENNTMEIVEFTWKEIKRSVCFSKDCQKRYLIGTADVLLNLHQMSYMKKNSELSDWYKDLSKEYELNLSLCNLM